MRPVTAILVALSAGVLAPRQDPEAPKRVVISVVFDSKDRIAARSVLEEAYRRIGHEVEFRPYSAADALVASTTGEVDAELQRIDGIDRDYPTLVQIPVPINYVQGTAFSKEHRFPVTSWNSLRPYRIGIVAGILFAERGTQGMDVVSAKDYEELHRLFREDLIDVAVLPRIEGLAWLEQEGIEDVQQMRGVLETLFIYHYVHESRAELVGLLQPVLKEMLLDGTTRKLREEAHRKILGRDS